VAEAVFLGIFNWDTAVSADMRDTRRPFDCLLLVSRRVVSETGKGPDVLAGCDRTGTVKRNAVGNGRVTATGTIGDQVTAVVVDAESDLRDRPDDRVTPGKRGFRTASGGTVPVSRGLIGGG